MAKKRDETQSVVAIKIMFPQKEGKIDSLTTISHLREITLIKALSNEHIVRELDMFYNYPQKEFGIVYECGCNV